MKQTIKVKNKKYFFFQNSNSNLTLTFYHLRTNKIYTLQLHVCTHKTHEAYTRKCDINTNERAK